MSKQFPRSIGLSNIETAKREGKTLELVDDWDAQSDASSDVGDYTFGQTELDVDFQTSHLPMDEGAKIPISTNHEDYPPWDLPERYGKKGLSFHHENSINLNIDEKLINKKKLLRSTNSMTYRYKKPDWHTAEEKRKVVENNIRTSVNLSMWNSKGLTKDNIIPKDQFETTNRQTNNKTINLIKEHPEDLQKDAERRKKVSQDQKATSHFIIGDDTTDEERHQTETRKHYTAKFQPISRPHIDLSRSSWKGFGDYATPRSQAQDTYQKAGFNDKEEPSYYKRPKREKTIIRDNRNYVCNFVLDDETETEPQKLETTKQKEFPAYGSISYRRHKIPEELYASTIKYGTGNNNQFATTNADFEKRRLAHEKEAQNMRAAGEVKGFKFTVADLRKNHWDHRDDLEGPGPMTTESRDNYKRRSLAAQRKGRLDSRKVVLVRNKEDHIKMDRGEVTDYSTSTGDAFSKPEAMQAELERARQLREELNKSHWGLSEDEEGDMMKTVTQQSFVNPRDQKHAALNSKWNKKHGNSVGGSNHGRHMLKHKNKNNNSGVPDHLVDHVTMEYASFSPEPTDKSLAFRTTSGTTFTAKERAVRDAFDIGLNVHHFKVGGKKFTGRTTYRAGFKDRVSKAVSKGVLPSNPRKKINKKAVHLDSVGASASAKSSLMH